MWTLKQTMCLFMVSSIYIPLLLLHFYKHSIFAYLGIKKYLIGPSQKKAKKYVFYICSSIFTKNNKKNILHVYLEFYNKFIKLIRSLAQIK
jgi:hypothetical protein